MKQISILFVCSLLIAGCSVFGNRSGYEQPGYKVVESLGESTEIRAYEPRVAAEARVENEDLDEGRDAAFRLLFDYITGSNRTAAKIAMTVPVESTGTSEKIAMTAPVESSRTRDNRVYMRFFLPARFDRETAPRPLDPRITIVDVPVQTVAVLRFSGFGGEDTVAEKKWELLRSLATTSWKPLSDSVVYSYDPPWTLPFFRRNEVVVAVGR
jgi:hypothetical protein